MRMHTPQRQYHLPAPLRAPARCRARSHPSYGTTALPAGISLTVPTVDHHVLPFPPRDSLLTQGQAVLNIDLQSTKDGFSECVLIFDECRWFPEATLSLCCVLLGSCLLQVSQVVSLEMNPAWKHSFFFFFWNETVQPCLLELLLLWCWSPTRQALVTWGLKSNMYREKTWNYTVAQSGMFKQFSLVFLESLILVVFIQCCDISR